MHICGLLEFALPEPTRWTLRAAARSAAPKRATRIRQAPPHSPARIQFRLADAGRRHVVWIVAALRFPRDFRRRRARPGVCVHLHAIAHRLERRSCSTEIRLEATLPRSRGLRSTPLAAGGVGPQPRATAASGLAARGHHDERSDATPELQNVREQVSGGRRGRHGRGARGGSAAEASEPCWLCWTDFLRSQREKAVSMLRVDPLAAALHMWAISLSRSGRPSTQWTPRASWTPDRPVVLRTPSRSSPSRRWALTCTC